MAQADLVGPEALLKASSDCKLRLVRLLVDGGTLVNVRNNNQETPLILACKSESAEKEKVVEFLIKHRVKMNLQDVNGKTALMYACLTSSSDHLVRMLVNAKANPWVKDESKNTAFDHAINAGNIGTVKVMIQACREGKILSKPGSFNMEMKRLEDKLDQMPEARKCSWPLMGPRSTVTKEKKVSQQSELLAVNEDEENGSPIHERRRKKSICHFDPIDIDPEADENNDSFTKPLRKESLYSVGRSSSEDERISLHFSDSDNSSFDRSSIHFSSLEKLIRVRDSITSSVESNEPINSQTSTTLKLDMAWSLENHKPLVTSHEEEKPENNELKTGEMTEANKQNSEVDLTITLDNTHNTFDKIKDDQLNLQRENNFIKSESSLGTHEKHLLESTKCSPLSLRKKLPSPSALRRKTLGSFAGQKDDVMESGDTRKSGNESTATRRVTVSTMESSSLVPLHSDSSSPEIKLNRKKIRPLEVDLTSKTNVNSEKIKRPSDSSRNKTNEASDIPKKISLPIISKPDERDFDSNEAKSVKSIEKTSVRRTLSDSICQGKRGNVIMTRSDNRLGVSGNELFTDNHPASCFSSQSHTGYRERSASSPLDPPREDSPLVERNAFLRCDPVMTSASRDVPRGRGPRYTVAGDLPDLVLHSPARTFSPSNLDSFKHELQINDSMQRLSRSVSPEILSPGTGSHLTMSKSNSFSYLPEVVSSATGSPKEKRVALLPPLNISRKQTDTEEGYFSCSPSPLDLESPNRGKDKSRYCFNKPLSPRLSTRPVRNLLP